MPGKIADERLEIPGLAEVAIDRSEAHIGDRIQRPESLHHQCANMLAGDFGIARTLKLTHDAADHTLDALAVHSAFTQGYIDGTFKFVALEQLLAARALGDDKFPQLHPLEGRETTSAVGANPTAANGRMVLGGAGILDLRVKTAAIGTTHACGALSRRWGSGA